MIDKKHLTGKKEKNFEVIDILLDEKFKAWVKDPNEENSSYWQTWLKEHPDQKENFFKARKMLIALINLPRIEYKFSSQDQDQLFLELCVLVSGKFPDRQVDPSHEYS